VSEKILKSACAKLTTKAKNAPIDQSSKRLFKTLFFVNTANGKTSAFNEQRWNGKYSIGEPHDTKLKMIARMPEKERIPRTIVFTLVDLFLKRKYNPTIMPAPNKSDIIWQKPNVPQTIKPQKNK
jgi:hypothetical protein